MKDTWIGNRARIAGFSLQGTSRSPPLRAASPPTRTRNDYELATTYSNYDLPRTFPEDSEYRKYQGTALGSKLRMPSAILARIQLRELDARNPGVAQMAKLNARLAELPGVEIPRCRPDVSRVYYSRTCCSLTRRRWARRADLVKALAAEGVDILVYVDPAPHLPGVQREQVVAAHATPARGRARLRPGQPGDVNSPTSPPTSPNSSSSTWPPSRRSGRPQEPGVTALRQAK